MANASQAAGLGLAAALADISCEGRVPPKAVFVPRKFPPEFKRDVVTVDRRGDLPVNEVAADFEVTPETVPRWMRQADADDGVKDGLTSSEQSEIVQLRRVSEPVTGNRHDMAKLKGSAVEKILKKAGGVFGDKGFIGD